MFEIETLPDYTDETLLRELRRVADLISSPAITRTSFDGVARASSSTYVKRFGGWRESLELAGLENRYSGQPVTQKMRVQSGREMTDEEILAEIQAVAKRLGTDELAQEDFNRESRINAATATRRFGCWQDALTRAGLTVPVHGRRYDEEEYFLNLRRVWTHHGRQPTYGEMSAPPSLITPGGYDKKFGGWRKALHAFVEWANSDELA